MTATTAEEIQALEEELELCEAEVDLRRYEIEFEGIAPELAKWLRLRISFLDKRIKKLKKAQGERISFKEWEKRVAEGLGGKRR